MIVVTATLGEDALRIAYVLQRAGLSVLGEPEPPALEAIEEDDSSWYADVINEGVFYETNPHGERYLHPAQVHGQVVCMTALGVTKSDPTYLDHVVMVVRSWDAHPEPGRWLRAVYEQIADASLRRYPTHFVTLRSLGESPLKAAEALRAFLGGPVLNASKLEGTLGRVPTPISVSCSPHGALMADLYDVLHEGRELSDDMVQRLTEAVQSQAD